MMRSNAATTRFVRGLIAATKGTAYRVSVTATNRAGTGEAAMVHAVTPKAQRVPLAPSDVRVVANGVGSVGLQWSPPVDFGTSPITSYTVTASPGGATVSATTTRATVTGLNPATEYTFTVAARNAVGPGVASSVSEPLLPKLTVGNAPAQVTNLTPGALLILQPTAAAEQGFFGKVAQVRREGTRVLLSTDEAALREAISEGGLSLDSRIDRSEIAEFTPLVPGVRLSEPTINGRTARQSAGKSLGVGVGPPHQISGTSRTRR